MAFIILDNFGNEINVVMFTSKNYGIEDIIEVAKFKNVKDAEKCSQDVQNPQIVNTNISKAIFGEENLIDIVELTRKLPADASPEIVVAYYMKTKFKEKYESE